jgi:hypothetical protein
LIQDVSRTKCGHFPRIVCCNRLDGGVQGMLSWMFCSSKVVFEVRKILVGVDGSTPPEGGSTSSMLVQESNGLVA